MKEQVIATRNSRVSRGAAAQPRGLVQRPARRSGATGGRERSFSPRALFAYVPSALKFILAILAMVTLFVGYRMAASASMLQVLSFDLSVASRSFSERTEVLTRRTLV